MESIDPFEFEVFNEYVARAMRFRRTIDWRPVNFPGDSSVASTHFEQAMGALGLSQCHPKIRALFKKQPLKTPRRFIAWALAALRSKKAEEEHVCLGLRKQYLEHVIQ